MSLALRNAVSPLVIGAATTPSTARMPPIMPSQFSETLTTTSGAEAASDAPVSAAPPSKKNQEETVAQIKATIPSVIIAP